MSPALPNERVMYQTTPFVPKEHPAAPAIAHNAREALAGFWRFIAERHEVFIRRPLLKPAPPWTDDPILRHEKFTNVYRDLDRATRWLMVHVVEHTPLEPSDLAFAILVYRRFNVPETFTAIGGARARLTYHWPEARRVLAERKLARTPIFTGAFIISADRSGRMKYDQVIGDLEETAQRWPDAWAAMGYSKSLKQAHHTLTGLPGLGGFMAYECLIDYCNTGLLPHSLDEWVYVGPGALRGLRALWPQTMPREAPAMIRALADSQGESLQRAGVRLRGPRLTLENIENCLCEYSKYVQARAGKHTKRHYRGPQTKGEDLWQELPARFTGMAETRPDA